MRLLDFGSGQGDFLQKAGARWPDAELAGIELSEKAVGMTRRKIPWAHVFAANLFAPSIQLRELEQWADAAVCSEVLEHVDDPTAFLRAAARYCASGAKLLVTVPGGPMSSFDRHIGHRQHFTAGKLSRILDAGGWEVRRVLRAGFPFFNIYRALVIARGDKLAGDVTAKSTGSVLRLGRSAMRLFRILFCATLLDSPFGWQIIALACKR